MIGPERIGCFASILVLYSGVGTALLSVIFVFGSSSEVQEEPN